MSNTIRQCLTVLVAGLIAGAGCSVTGGGGDRAPEPDSVVAEQTTSKDREFIRRVVSTRRHPAHPVDVDAPALAQTLRRLRLEKDGENRRLFLDSEIKRLVPPLVRALGRLTPGQEVTFAVVGKHTSGGPLAPDAVTTGRVFASDGELQMILGLAQYPFGAELRVGGYLRPFVPGRVDERVESGWTASAGDAAGVSVRPRGDWLSLDLAAMDAAAAPGSDGSSAGDGERRSAPAATTEQRSPRDRLETLEALHRDGLISDREYEAKRREIIDEL